MSDDKRWLTKLAARIHDPGEKALVLFRDRAGHEGGTVRALRDLLMPKDEDGELSRHVHWADWWAAAADRPQWPKETWAEVRWATDPVLIHPLSGRKSDLHSLSATEVGDIKERSWDHLLRILEALGIKEGADRDLRKAALALWRFGPELREEDDNGKLGELWKLLPADTRIPDHSIWDHLDLASAFAGAFAADPGNQASLLALSIGPVQGFIAAARSTSDLWAGSHLLSCLAFEAMRPVIERLGPDAVLFPRLRGVPQVDLWLRDDMKLPEALFEGCEWQKGATDSNPLFSAALPNRFVAVVPAGEAEALAEEAKRSVRDWLQKLGKEVVDRLLEAAGFNTEGEVYAHVQMRDQLAGFPEVHFAAVPFSLIRPRDKEKQRDLDVTALSAAMKPFFGREGAGFLASDAWKILQKDVELDGQTFFAPNPGVLYPAIYDLAERALAAAKATRAFDQTRQEGWRCALTGETEWLTTDPAQLETSYRERDDTLWAKIADHRPAWAKKGEHLGALPAIKRLWPTIFAERVGMIGGRFVVSTNAMALARQIENWLKKGEISKDARQLVSGAETAALPRKLLLDHGRNVEALDIAKRLPAILDAAREGEDYEKEKQVCDVLGGRLETYYSLLLMDGDHMGRVLSGEDENNAITYLDSFHPKVREGFSKRAGNSPRLQAYGNRKRALSPGRHLAISSALNDFSLSVARHVIEAEHLGRLIYAGGDDVLAMLPVADLLPAMQRLRRAYSGHDEEDESGVTRRGLILKNGFALLNGRLMRLMGTKATASIGAVVAHHQAPLAAVRRELEAAEKRSKTEGGRDAFSITVVKRSGGALYVTAKWGEALDALIATRDFVASEDVSRRAVYHVLAWLKDLPEPEGQGAMLGSLLNYQLARQAQGKKDEARALAARLSPLAVKHGLKWLANFLSVAEFLARETHGGGA